MSYYGDHSKYGDFFNSYNPNRQTSQRKPPKRKKRRLKPRVKCALFIIVCVTVVLATKPLWSSSTNNTATSSISDFDASDVTSSTLQTEQQTTVKYNSTTSTAILGEQIASKYAILVDTSDNTILARRNADAKIFPASMTKVMTLLVVAENIDDISKTFTMTSSIIDPLYTNGLTLAGFGPGEEVKLIDMIYGMVLKSGAEASVGLATYISGSEEKFVELMNSKIKSLGLKNTNFTNVSGAHSSNHYTTCSDMAVIMQAVINNDFCRKVISTEYYTVAANTYHDTLNFHSGMFEKMYGTEPQVATIKGGKTGFTSQSLYCLASFAQTDDGRDIICVTAQGETKYTPIYDCIKLYKEYTHPVK